MLGAHGAYSTLVLVKLDTLCAHGATSATTDLSVTFGNPMVTAIRYSTMKPMMKCETEPEAITTNRFHVE